MPSRSQDWQRVRGVEDALALLDRVDERRCIIRRQAWGEGSFDAIYQEATAMTDDIADLKDFLSARWADLFAITQSSTSVPSVDTSVDISVDKEDSK
jgi:hypothetical protein